MKENSHKKCEFETIVLKSKIEKEENCVCKNKKIVDAYHNKHLSRNIRLSWVIYSWINKWSHKRITFLDFIRNQVPFSSRTSDERIYLKSTSQHLALLSDKAIVQVIETC